MKIIKIYFFISLLISFMIIYITEPEAHIIIKNKLSKRLFPINLIDGKLKEGESIYANGNEIGKVLIENDYPFALIKYLDKNFDEKLNFKTKDANLNIKKPDWIK